MNQLMHETLKSFVILYISQEEYAELASKCKNYPFLVSDEGICILKQKQSSSSCYFCLQAISTHVKIIKRLRNLDTDKITILLEYFDGVNIVQKEFPRSILSRLELKQLLPYGIRYSERECDFLVQYLLLTESESEMCYVHSEIGWANLGESVVFKSYHLFSSSDRPAILSKYYGKLKICPKGTLDTWLDLVRTEILGNTPLTFCMLLGFASPILSYIGEKYDLGSLIFTLSNTSSRGKTTSAMLATSVFSCPILNCGTLRSFHATQNFLVSFLSQVSGLTVSLDEGATFNGGFNQLLYLLAGGSDKGRLNSDSSIKPSRNWQSVILTTSEFDFLDDTSPAGLRTRCFSITDNLTSSAKNADKIKNIVTENYGLAGEAFIQWLIDKKLNELEQDYLLSKKSLSQKVKNATPLTERVLSKLAIISLTTQYVNNCFNFSISSDVIDDYILTLEKITSNCDNPTDTFLVQLVQEIGSNSSRFLTADRPDAQNAVGKIVEDDDSKTIAIQKDWFKLFCKQHHFQNSHEILEKLKKDQYLQCEKDRLTKRVRLNKNCPIQPCYIFEIPDRKERRDYISSRIEDSARELKHDMINLNIDDIDF